jgi:hypothetical protein
VELKARLVTAPILRKPIKGVHFSYTLIGVCWDLEWC